MPNISSAVETLEFLPQHFPDIFSIHRKWLSVHPILKTHRGRFKILETAVYPHIHQLKQSEFQQLLFVLTTNSDSFY